MKFVVFGILALALCMVDHCLTADVTGEVRWPPVSKTGQTKPNRLYVAKYREFHESSTIRIAKFECSQVGSKKFQKTTCFKNPNPHANCDYTKENASGYYEDLASKFASYGCKARSVALSGDCTWQKTNCPRN